MSFLKRFLVFVGVFPVAMTTPNPYFGRMICPDTRPIKCYPTATCCADDEYCNSRGSACLPCLPSLDEKETLQWCKTVAWNNVSVYPSIHCTAACYHRYGAEKLTEGIHRRLQPNGPIVTNSSTKHKERGADSFGDSDQTFTLRMSPALFIGVAIGFNISMICTAFVAILHRRKNITKSIPYGGCASRPNIRQHEEGSVTLLPKHTGTKPPEDIERNGTLEDREERDNDASDSIDKPADDEEDNGPGKRPDRKDTTYLCPSAPFQQARPHDSGEDNETLQGVQHFVSRYSTDSGHNQTQHNPCLTNMSRY